MSHADDRAGFSSEGGNISCQPRLWVLLQETYFRGWQRPMHGATSFPPERGKAESKRTIRLTSCLGVGGNNQAAGDANAQGCLTDTAKYARWQMKKGCRIKYCKHGKITNTIQ